MLYSINLSRRRFRYTINAFYFYSPIAYSCCIWITCLRASWTLFRNWRSDHGIFQNMIINGYIILVFLMFASTFKVLTGLSLAIVLARFLARRGATRWQPRNLSNGDSSLVKIGVNLVSCSCWEMESHRHRCFTTRFRHQPLETICCTHRPGWSCTTYFVPCLEFLYQVGTSSANSNPGAGEHTGRFSGNLLSQKSGRDRLGIRARLTIG